MARAICGALTCRRSILRLHSEIGVAVSEGLRPRWSYVQGTARERLPGLLSQLGMIDLFVHDSLHTGRNQQFELDSAWRSLRPGGAAVVDDIDHSLAFRTFVGEARPQEWLAARHITGPGLMGSEGLWGLAVKGAQAPAPQAQRPGRPGMPPGQSAAPDGSCRHIAGYRGEPALPRPEHA